MAKIDLILSEAMLEEKIIHYIPWDTEQSAHMGISGITGTGKTYLVKLCLARVSKYIPDSQITVCVFKGQDFLFLRNCTRYYRFDDCKNGFNAFYESFLERQHNNDSNSFQLLMFDEWGSYLNYLDKKEAEDSKKKLSSLLMLGRSFNYHVLLSQQRLDAESFGKSRDNFGIIILLGNVSKEVRSMFFSEFGDKIKSDRTRGTGYMLVNGADFKQIIVPQIKDMDLVHAYIKQAIER